MIYSEQDMSNAIGFGFGLGLIVGLALAGLLFVLLKYGYMIRFREYLFTLKSKERDTIDSSVDAIKTVVDDFAVRTNTSFFKKMSNDLNDLKLFLERKRP